MYKLELGMTVSNLCTEIGAGAIDGFELSNQLDAVLIGITEHDLECLLTSLAHRCLTDPDFRQDLIDFDILKPLMVICVKRNCVIPREIIPSLVGPSKDVKLILNETGVVNQYAEELSRYFEDPNGRQQHLLEAIITLTTACNDNKLKFIKLPDIINKFLTALSLHVDFDLLTVLITLVSEDDREGRIPAPVFARDQLVDASHLPRLIDIFRIYIADPRGKKSCILNLVRELSVSQDLTRLFAVEEGCMKIALSGLKEGNIEMRIAAIRYIRQISFSDDMKADLVAELRGSESPMTGILEEARKNRIVMSHLFGILANICLKNVELSVEISTTFPHILSLGHHALESTSMYDVTQCLLFLRLLGKSQDGRGLLLQFDDIIEKLTKSNDSTFESCMHSHPEMATVYHLVQRGTEDEGNAHNASLFALESLIVKLCISINATEQSGGSLTALTHLTGKRNNLKGTILASPLKLKQLAQTVYLLNMIHRLYIENRQVNQREMFYRSLSDPVSPSYPDQASMNRALFCVMNAIGCDRHELGIFTTARGLVAADSHEQTLCLDSKSEFIADVSDHPDGMAICESLVDICTIQTNAKFVLIVEKDTVFQSLLCCDSFFEHNPCIMVTARGYPDNITIRFLQKLSQIFEGRIPFVYLGDLDPHGVSIALVYNRALENNLHWIGLHSSDVSILDHQRVLGIKMKPCDIALLNGLIEQTTTPATYKTELAKIESMGMKFEIECLHSVGESYISTTWLPSKVAFLKV